MKGGMVSAEAAGPSACGDVEKCPRCGSQNTKFCYYNNYNLAQPRHFCKACRRYWTVGGSLRNVPVGGSIRRAAAQSQSSVASLRRRSAAAAPPLASSPSSSSSSSPTMAAAAAPPPEPEHLDAVRCFESLLAEPLPAGFLALGDPFLAGHDGFALGLGLGHGDEMGVPAWPFYGDGGADSNGVGRDDTWRVAGDDGGDCFDWPDLSVEKNAH